MISIITPTYNRENELKNVYNSLLNQKNKDFEWIIVDDGSTDNTKEVVLKFKKDKKIKINYFYKVNGGKPSAYNIGVEKAIGDILVCLDSDDVFTPDAVDIISKDYKKIINNNEIAGLVYNASYSSNPKEIIGVSLPNNVVDTYYNIYDKYKSKGDKVQIIKTKVAKEFPFPQIDNEKFVPEALINNRISKKYKFLYSDKSIELKEYLEDGYTSHYFELVKKNSKSNALYFNELYDFKPSVYNIYGYLLFSIYSSYSFKEIFNNHKNKIMIIIMYLPVLLISKIK